MILAAGPSAWGAEKLTPEMAFAALARSKVGDGRMIAPFYLGVIGPHVLVARGTVYCAFQNSQGKPIVMAYRPDRKAWDGPVRASDFGLRGDDHGNPALAIDRDGHLHVFYGCHGGPMRHARSRGPYDIGEWDEQPPPAPKATYPQVMRMADGSLCLFYRAGGHPEPWCLRRSSDDGRTWSQAEKIIEMRKDPPDGLACAYAYFMPGSDGRTVHCFWNHKDDNAARVTPARPHPWRPLKYPGLHEAVYRYNVYYLCRDPNGAWRAADGQGVALPVTKALADRSCMAYDSGDEFTFLGTSLAVDRQDRPYIRFGTGVVDWVRKARETADSPQPKAVVVPPTQRYVTLAEGKWHVSRQAPDHWPAEVLRIVHMPGSLAYGEEWPGGQWFIDSRRWPGDEQAGSSVFLLHDADGCIRRQGGPAAVE